MDLRSLRRVPLAWVVTACLIGVILAQGSLMIEPKESIVVQGENVTLTCHYTRVNSSEGEDRFWWLRPDHNFRFVRNEAVLLGSLQRERYSVLLNREASTYALTIRNVQLLDGGNFMCSHRRDRYKNAASSEVSTVTVLVPPPGGYPSCPFLAKSNLILSPWKGAALACPKLSFRDFLHDREQDQRKGNVYFSWGSLEGFILQNRTTLLSYSSSAEFPSKGKFCMTDHQILGQFPDRCTLVGEADATVVLIHPAGVHVRVSENMTFACKVLGAIRGVRYDWSIPTNLQSERIEVIQEGSKVILINVRETEHKLRPQSIGCTVTLENGELKRALANVTVIDHHGGHWSGNGQDVGIATTLTEQPDNGIINQAADTQNAHKTSKMSLADFVTDHEKMAIVLGPSLAVVIFFLCLYATLRFAAKRKATVTPPPRIITTPPLDSATKKVNTSGEATLHIPAFSRSYSDATSYRFSRNFDVHNTFQKDEISTADDINRGKGEVPAMNRRHGSRHHGGQTELHMNASMPALNYKSNTLPNKGRRSQELPPPPNSFMDLPQEVARSASYIEPPSVDWRPKRSVHFAVTPSKQMKKVKT